MLPASTNKEGMEINKAGQVFYPQEAYALVPTGCIALVNEHGACMDRGCAWCSVYYYGPTILDDLDEQGWDTWEDAYQEEA